MENVVLQAVPLDAVSKFVQMKVDSLAEAEDIFQIPMLNFIKHPLFTVPITCLMKQQAQFVASVEPSSVSKALLMIIRKSEPFYRRLFEWDVSRHIAYVDGRQEKTEEEDVSLTVKIVYAVYIDVREKMIQERPDQ